MQKRESLFKYQSRIYNFLKNSGVNHRGMKMRWNNKNFTSLNFINGKTSPYGSKGVIKKLPLLVRSKIRPGSFCNYKNSMQLTCLHRYNISILGLKIKVTVNYPRYGIVYNCKYSQILCCRNNWTIFIFWWLIRWRRLRTR